MSTRSIILAVSHLDVSWLLPASLIGTTVSRMQLCFNCCVCLLVRAYNVHTVQVRLPICEITVINPGKSLGSLRARRINLEPVPLFRWDGRCGVTPTGADGFFCQHRPLFLIKVGNSAPFTCSRAQLLVFSPFPTTQTTSLWLATETRQQERQ